MKLLNVVGRTSCHAAADLGHRAKTCCELQLQHCAFFDLLRHVRVMLESCRDKPGLSYHHCEAVPEPSRTTLLKPRPHARKQVPNLLHHNVSEAGRSSEPTRIEAPDMKSQVPAQAWCQTHFPPRMESCVEDKDHQTVDTGAFVKSRCLVSQQQVTVWRFSSVAHLCPG